MRLRWPRPPRAARAGFALRWIAVTPTFAVGLGVVIAAAMSGPAPGLHVTFGHDWSPCTATACGGKGTLASRPGSRRLPAFRSRHQATGGGGSAASEASAFTVSYHTASQGWYGQFIGEITVASRNGKPLRPWTLQFSYRSGQVKWVRYGAVVVHGPHTVRVASGEYRGGTHGDWSATVIFSVTGQPRPPAGCIINGAPCNIVINSGTGNGNGQGTGGNGGNGWTGGGGGWFSGWEGLAGRGGGHGARRLERFWHGPPGMPPREAAGRRQDRSTAAVSRQSRTATAILLTSYQGGQDHPHAAGRAARRPFAVPPGTRTASPAPAPRRPGLSG